ncbi:hypothetical protein E4U60_006500 [Claviceps pazoutovae]|uniref:Uncharacterized protein n=1 Tax=Claviceps pazoutovae TaxID=1649127 RepID=A0A9P7MGY8_9HYPO|nr:hypothetical protein E4U60_006500 [Claviceps pazoutovae]
MNVAFNLVRLLFQKPCGAGNVSSANDIDHAIGGDIALGTCTTFQPCLLVYFPHKAVQDRLIAGVVDRPAWKLPLGGGAGDDLVPGEVI